MSRLPEATGTVSPTAEEKPRVVVKWTLRWGTKDALGIARANRAVCGLNWMIG